jgi:hypothetical protein
LNLTRFHSIQITAAMRPLILARRYEKNRSLSVNVQ